MLHLVQLLANTQTSAAATAGIMGVMQGCSYISAEGQLLFKNFLPANLVTGGATEVKIFVNDDPNACFQIKAERCWYSNGGAAACVAY